MKRTVVVTLLCVLTAQAAVKPLAGTRPLQWKEEDLSERLMDGAHLFVERQIRQARAKRAEFWKENSSLAENRKRLQEIIGAVDSRLPAQMEQLGQDVSRASRPRIAGKMPATREVDTRNPAYIACLLYTSPSPRDLSTSRMPSSA